MTPMFKQKTPKCKNCSKEFEQKQPLQNCCCYDCFVEYKDKKHKERFDFKKEIQDFVNETHGKNQETIKEFKKSVSGLNKALIKKGYINPVSKTNSNTRRTMTEETIQEVYTRDNFRCIIDQRTNLDLPHHAYFGSEANHKENRNEPDQLVTLCMDCHYDIHSKGNNIKRQLCKDYLEKKYAKSTI